MNATSGPFVNAMRPKPAASLFVRLSVCAVAAATLGGCANPFATAPVNPGSPVAPEVARLARSNRDFPTFAEIPPKPTDVRPPRRWGVAGAETEQARDRLDQDTAPATWTLNNTATFATGAQAKAGPELGAPDTAGTEAFAKKLRDRATPPPPPR
jgi:hypothetical protein